MAGRFDFWIRTQQDLIDAIDTFGFVPLFCNSIPGFPIEEHVDPVAWFDSGTDGVWEWKGPVIQSTRCAYGKFFLHKAAFIRHDLFIDFANYRRCGDDFEMLYENGEASRTDKHLYDLIAENGPVLSSRLKVLGDYGRGGRKGFDTILSRLQAETYVLISDFVYQRDRFGQPYGWGVAEYSTPEQFFGADFSARVCDCTPEESYQKLTDCLCDLLGVSEATIKRVL